MRFLRKKRPETPDGQLRAQQRPSPPSSTSGTCNEPPQPLLDSDKQTQELVGGSLWERAANGLDPEDQEKLKRLKSKREDQAVGSPSNGETSQTTTHGAGPSADIDIVLRKVDNLKEKDKEGTWRPVSSTPAWNALLPPLPPLPLAAHA